MNHKKVSILMSVYNGEEYLEETMESILTQTYSNWECVVVDDCSTDRTPEILAACVKKDPRVRVYRNEVNRKLPVSLNRAIQEAKGEYLLRMDADDICRRDRIEKQVQYMEKHSELDMSCCRFFILVGKEMTPACVQRRGDADALDALLLFFNPICHPGVIIRRSSFPDLSYDPSFSYAEDLDLWTRMAEDHKKLGIQEDFLLIYRIHGNQVTQTKRIPQREQYCEIADRFYRKRMFALERAELCFLSEGIYHRDYLDVDSFVAFLHKVRNVNKKNGSMKREAVEYAAFEVVAAYRGEYSLTKDQLLILMSAFRPIFLVKEYARRRKAYRQGMILCRQAAREFGAKETRVDINDHLPRFLL